MEREMTVIFPGGSRISAQYKGFLIETDQPVYSGGEGTAPAPFDLFLASIATCSGYYVLSFCQKRGIPTEKAYLKMTAKRNPGTKRIEKISIAIQLPPEFPEKYRQAVLRAVDTCSVKEHILNPPAFEITAEIGR